MSKFVLRDKRTGCFMAGDDDVRNIAEDIEVARVFDSEKSAEHMTYMYYGADDIQKSDLAGKVELVRAPMHWIGPEISKERFYFPEWEIREIKRVLIDINP